MVEIPVSWTIRVQGGQQTASTISNLKQRFAELQSQLKSGKITNEQYAQGMKQIKRESDNLTSGVRAQKAMFQAAHPAINQMTRSLSIMRSASHNLVSVMSLLTLTQFSATQYKTKMAEINAEITELQRRLSEEGLSDEERADIEGKINALNERQKETSALYSEEERQKVVNYGISIFDMGANFALTGLAIGKAWPQITKFVGILITGLPFVLAWTAALWPLWLVIGAVALALYLILTPGDQVKEFFEWLTGMDLDGASQAVDDFFTKTIPGAFYWARDTIVSVWNQINSGISGFITTIIGNVTKFVGGIIEQVQKAIDWLAKLPQNIISGATSFVQNPVGSMTSAAKTVSNTLLSFINPPKTTSSVKKAAVGFSGIVSRPTTFVAGEGGAEAVSISPIGKANHAGGGGNTIIINVAGSIWSEKELMGKVDDYFKTSFRRRGF